MITVARFIYQMAFETDEDLANWMQQNPNHIIDLCTELNVSAEDLKEKEE